MAYKDPERKQAYNKAYHAAHRGDVMSSHGREKRQAQWRAYYYRHLGEHREQTNARSKAYGAVHSVERAAYNRAYYRLRNKELRAAHSKWYRENYAAHRDKFAARSAKRRALKLGASVETINFKQILRDSKGLCGICKKPLDLFGIDFDHIVPLAKGGTHTRDNLQAAHQYCNRAKGARVG